jgi:hypothetical protein
LSQRTLAEAVAIVPRNNTPIYGIDPRRLALRLATYVHKTALSAIVSKTARDSVLAYAPLAVQDSEKEKGLASLQSLL